MFLKENKSDFINFKCIKNVHLIGAGGIGMAGLRKWLEVLEYNITCSDDANSYTDFIPENEIPYNAECMIVSSAIKDNHPQYLFALQNNIPVIHRSIATKHLMSGEVICISGAHGKTTSSGIIAHCLSKHRSDISFLLGGVLQDTHESAQYVKDSSLCIVEGDESDGSMNIMSGKYHLLTNIAEEHMDYYKTWDNYIAEMQKFASHAEYLVAHISCKGHLIRDDASWYGNGSNYYASNIIIDRNGSMFDAIGPWGTWKQMQISLPGHHFVENCIGCMIILHKLGLSESIIRDGLATFNGLQKRMERIIVNGITIIQDYAHHPTEVGAMIDMAREVYNGGVVHVIWEPHKFSRISHGDNFSIFMTHLKKADKVLVLPVWSAGEEHDPNFTHKKIVDAINGIEINTHYDIARYINENVKQNDVVLAMGAGGVYKIVNKAIDILEAGKYNE